MNKTVTINISGIIFHIEEDAYLKLSQYLIAIKKCFSTDEGANEIMSDIESRIAEMLQGKVSAYKQVVLMSDVDYVINSMGKPEDFYEGAQDNQSNEETYSSSASHQETSKKRIFRDGDSKVLGGVCSGIGHYFGFDAVWMRIALLLLFFFGGTGFLLYLILWIAIPEAKTTTEKLMMKGERPDISNISKAVKEEAEQFKKRAEKFGEDFKNKAHEYKDEPRNFAEKAVYFLMDVITNIAKVSLKIIGVAMVVFGVIVFLGLFSSVFGISYTSFNLEGKELIDMLLLDGKDLYIGLIGISIFIGVPMIMMIYGGIKLIFKIHYANRWINLTAGIFWLIGLSMLIYVGVKTGIDFSQEAKSRDKIEIIPYQHLSLKAKDLPIAYTISDDESDEDIDALKKKYSDNYFFGMLSEQKYLFGQPQLNIIKSQTNTIELVTIKEARAKDKKSAVYRADQIDYSVIQKDSIVYFDNAFKLPINQKFRMQDVSLILKIPVNQVIFIDASMKNIIYDIENTTDTHDNDMINRRWMMTEAGLKCVDCDGIESKI